MVAYTCCGQMSKRTRLVGACTLVTYTCGGQMSKGRAYTLFAYTCSGQMSEGCAYKLVAYTCGGQKSNGCTYMLVPYTCGGQKSRKHAYTVIAYTCGGQKSKVRVPELPRIPFYALRGPLTPVLGPKSLKTPQKRQKRPFFRLLCPITQPPGGGSKKRGC